VTFAEIIEEVRSAAHAPDADERTLLRIDHDTYRAWKANSGNAKARRRWRRREVPNSQAVEEKSGG